MSRQSIIGTTLLVASMAVWSSPAAAQSRPGTLPSAGDSDGDGPVRTKAKKAGIIDPSSAKKKLDFDPKDLAGTAETKKSDELT